MPKRYNRSSPAPGQPHRSLRRPFSTEKCFGTHNGDSSRERQQSAVPGPSKLWVLAAVDVVALNFEAGDTRGNLAERNDISSINE
jgi:hypothetical protein